MSVSRRLVSGLILASVLTAVVTARQQRTLDLGASAFEGYIELLRQTAGIPGLSGVLIQDGRNGVVSSRLHTDLVLGNLYGIAEFWNTFPGAI